MSLNVLYRDVISAVRNFFLRQVTIYSTFSCKLLADQPRATLTAGTTIIPVGGSVTLTCSVQSSDGWKYEWFRRTQTTSEGKIRGQQNRDIRVSQGGIYRCRGTRGNPVYYTDRSDDVTIEITSWMSPSLLCCSPSTPQHRKVLQQPLTGKTSSGASCRC
uniref:Ig-like domain-containing protein n=1 Tax=Maylandia zebra TaxID=106582 RepID=A0A3P9DTK2_9CICH